MLGPASALPSETALLRVVVLLLVLAALPRRRGLALGAVGLAIVMAGLSLWRLTGAPGGLYDSAFELLQVGRLRPTLGLGLDWGTAAWLGVGLMLALAAALRGSRALRGALAALVVLVLADDLILVLGAWEWLVLLLAALGSGAAQEPEDRAVHDARVEPTITPRSTHQERAEGRAVVRQAHLERSESGFMAQVRLLDRVGAVALLGFVLTLFFGLGGSWSRAGRGFQVDVAGGEFPMLSTTPGPTPPGATPPSSQLQTGPTTSLRQLAALLAARSAVDPAGEGRLDPADDRPVRRLLGDKLLLGLPLRGALLGLLSLGLASRLLAMLGLAWRQRLLSIPARLLPVGLSLLAASSLALRLRGLWIALALLSLCGACSSAGPRLQVDGLALPAQGGSGIITLRSVGTAPLHLQRVTLSGDSAGFALTSPPPQALAPGATLPLEVRFTADGRRSQAFGAVQIFSDDPRGRDEARTPEPEALLGAPLSAGASPLVLLLPLLPLLAALVTLPLRRRPRAAQAVALAGAFTPPALALLGLLPRFRTDVGVAEGNYGFQLLFHATLLHRPALEWHVGVDGLSLLLLPLALLVPPLALLLGARAAQRPLLLQAALLLWLTALDLWLLGAAWLAALALCAASRRWLLVLPLALCAALALVRATQPTQLIDGTPVAHTTDLLRLLYQSYFGGDAVLIGRLPLAGAAHALLAVALLLPVVLLLSQRALPPLARALLPLLPVYGLLRLCAGALPEAAIASALTLSLCGALLAWLSVALDLRRGSSPRGLALSQLGLALLGVASLTQSGIGGALLLVLAQGLLPVLPSLRPGLLRRAVALGLPGTPLFAGQVLVLFGAFPDQRLCTLLAALALAARWLLPVRPALHDRQPEAAAGGMDRKATPSPILSPGGTDRKATPSPLLPPGGTDRKATPSPLLPPGGTDRKATPSPRLSPRLAWALLLPLALLLGLCPSWLLRRSAVAIADLVSHVGLRGAATVVQRAAAPEPLALGL